MMAKTPARFMVVLALIAACLLGDGAWGATKPRTPAKPRYAAIVVDAQSGEVLHAENSDAQRYPASLTKMMTLFMIFEAIDRKKIRFDTEWRVSAFAAGQSPTKLGLQAGRSIAVRDVVLGLITKSANDAAVVAAENLGGTESAFAELMTERAHRLGMSRTTFRNASGLPHPSQQTTASDLARLARAMIRTFPHHYHLFSTTQFAYGGITHHNHNRFMNWYDGADGLKTGYIHASGFNLAASALRQDRRLVGVVMGGPSPGWRDDRMGEILDAAFARRPKDRKPATPALEADQRPARNAPGAELAAHVDGAAATQARKPVPSGQAAAPRSGWSIQVGAYAELDQAQRAIQQARKLAPTPLQASAVDIQKIGGKGRDANLLRARLTGLTSKAARDACEALKSRRQVCLVVGPSVAQSSAIPSVAAQPPAVAATARPGG
jgi:D-alanyl-D-alanine carboxypeptidase